MQNLGRFICCDRTSSTPASFHRIGERSRGEDTMAGIKRLLAELLTAATERKVARDRAREFSVRDWADAHRTFWSTR